MYDSLSKYAPKGMSWNRPKGGYYIWCRLPAAISADKLVDIAAKHEVSFVPGSPFFVSGLIPEGEYIRLNFTYASIKDIEEGIKRLCAAVRELMDINAHSQIESAMPRILNPLYEVFTQEQIDLAAAEVVTISISSRYMCRRKAAELEIDMQYKYADRMSLLKASEIREL
jgi:hypothetical protein